MCSASATEGGLAWIWNIANEHFPTAVQIVDLYHARQLMGTQRNTFCLRYPTTVAMGKTTSKEVGCR
jgi:hypothetical protein